MVEEDDIRKEELQNKLNADRKQKDETNNNDDD